MNAHEANAGELVLKTWDRCRTLLPLAIRQTLAHPETDPHRFNQKGCDFMKLRLLPRRGLRRPECFWNLSWCFYEIGVGHFVNRGLSVGMVQFVQYPFQKVCGEGRFRDSTVAILKKAKLGPLSQFELVEAGGSSGQGTFLSRFYEAPTTPFFTVDEAGKDLAGLIETTLPQFLGLT